LFAKTLFDNTSKLEELALQPPTQPANDPPALPVKTLPDTTTGPPEREAPAPLPRIVLLTNVIEPLLLAETAPTFPSKLLPTVDMVPAPVMKSPQPLLEDMLQLPTDILPATF
jgi:hypothetical protein